VSALAGRRALVTGAGGGIGRGIAIELARQGARVVVHHADSDPDQTLAAIAAVGGEATTVRADLATVSECERVVAVATERLGGLDVLVNNAGISIEERIEDISEAEYDTMFAVNVRAAYVCTRAALSPFAAAGGDRAVVNLGSVQGGAVIPPAAAYAATKGAVHSLTAALAMELVHRGVRVNAVAPGLIEVPRYFDQPSKGEYRTEEGALAVPLGRVGHPRDVGAAAAFLASAAAGFVTGQVLYVDGGSTARLGMWWEGQRPGRAPEADA
jgi:NAD(P)-dependent dehydrogenase (short-subunit alcohol dehydrogenase family)